MEHPHPPGTTVVIKPANLYVGEQPRRLFRDTGDLQLVYWIDEPIVTLVISCKTTRRNPWIFVMVPGTTGFWWLPAKWAERI